MVSYIAVHLCVLFSVCKIYFIPVLEVSCNSKSFLENTRFAGLRVSNFSFAFATFHHLVTAMLWRIENHKKCDKNNNKLQPRKKLPLHLLLAGILKNCISLWAEETRNLWTVEEASTKLAVLPDVRPALLTAFKGGMRFDEKTNLNEFLKKKTYSVHDTRHDLSFLTPSARMVRCKVK